MVQLAMQIGALEYDPEILTQQRHREFLRDVVIFKEVVPIRDASLRGKIHQTYRMGYVKDVILPRVLDDNAFSMLSSMMLFNNVDVRPLSYQVNPSFQSLGLYSYPSLAKCSIAWGDYDVFCSDM